MDRLENGLVCARVRSSFDMRAHFLAPSWVRELAAIAASNHSLCGELAQDVTSMALETLLIRPLLPRATFHLTVIIIIIIFFPAEL